MLRFAKFLRKLEIELTTYRDGFQASVSERDKFDKDFVERSALIIIHPNTAKAFGLKDGQMVKVSAGERSLNLRIKVDEMAPENKALMPKSIYSSYLDSDKVTIEPTDDGVTTQDELLERYR